MPPPAGKKPGRSMRSEASMPIFATAGRKVSIRKSALGAMGLWVPPSRRSVDARSHCHSGGSTVCSTSIADPALPVAKR